MKFVSKRIALLASLLLAFSFLLPLPWAQTKNSTKETRPSVDVPAVKLQTLNIKPGLWESTRTIKRAGEMGIPPEMLNRLTPEQRARMEERMKANSAARSNTTTENHCVTKEDLEKDRLTLADAKGCTTTVVNSTSTSVKANLVCDIEGMHATGTLELVAADPEHLSGSSHSSIDANGHTMNVEGAWTSKWLSSSCSEVK